MKKRGNRWFAGAIALLWLSAAATTAQAFSFEEMDRIDQAEQGELLEAARKAAGQEDFDRAQSLIEQARNKRYAPQAVAGVEKLVREARAARDERLRREEQARLAQAEAERRAREQARVDGSGNKGGALNCAMVSKHYGLWNYCETGSCAGFSGGNYALWNLCENNDPAGYAGANFPVWHYLANGNAGGFTSNHKVWSAAEKQAGSFANRKRFIIYYLRGYIYE